MAHGCVKTQHENGVGSLRLEGSDTLGQRLQESGGFIGSDNSQGMGIEGGHHGRRAAGPGVDLGLSDHVLMSEVDTVEETQGQADSVRAEGLRSAQDDLGHQ